MNKIKFIENIDKESLGKLYFEKAVDFTVNREFGKAFEFFKEGLDFLTCDCQSGDWRKKFEKSDLDIFIDVEVQNVVHSEYFFVKAFLLSFEEGKKEQYIALDAIDRYLKVSEDEYGYYVRGKIWLALGEKNEAINNFYLAKQLANSPRIKYRIGRTKEQFLDEYGLEDLYNAFIENPSSCCCCRVLQKFSKSKGIQLDFHESESENIILKAFNESESELKFQNAYEKLFKKESIDNRPFGEWENNVIIEFVSILKRNSSLFIVEEEEDDYVEGDDYDDYDRGDYHDYDRDTFDALTDGQYGDYDDFRESGGDIDDVYTWLGRD
ncbi:MAG: hypothetical protein NW241_09710 [Bacteroidia bacterium]|nr:hypothetical protein [Bacteroidia bacterium]